MTGTLSQAADTFEILAEKIINNILTFYQSVLGN